MIVARKNESESLREARLVADVKRVIVAHEIKSESLREARLADDVERVIVAHSKLSISFKLSIIFKLSSCNLFTITSYRGLILVLYIMIVSSIRADCQFNTCRLSIYFHDNIHL